MESRHKNILIQKFNYIYCETSISGTQCVRKFFVCWSFQKEVGKKVTKIVPCAVWCAVYSKSSCRIFRRNRSYSIWLLILSCYITTELNDEQNKGVIKLIENHRLWYFRLCNYDLIYLRSRSQHFCINFIRL